MGGDASKYNNEKNLRINIESNKVCYFPGEIMTGTITLFPFQQSFEKIKANPKLYIIITEFKHYTYRAGGKRKKHYINVNEEKNLLNTIIEFGNFVSMDYSAGFKIPFSVQIPNDAYPSINFGDYNIVKHLFTVELPDVEAKRTKIFGVKHNFPNNLENNLLRNMIEGSQEFKKSKLFFDKGSCLLNVKIPKNYFFYNENIPFEVNLDCSNLKMEIKSLKIKLIRMEKLNLKENYLQSRSSFRKTINKKIIDLEKGLKNYHISDFLEFPKTSDYNSVYPPNVYKSFDEHGLIEVGDSKFSYYLFPSSRNGLLSVDYFIGIFINFDSSFTFDEELLIPIYFSANFENNNNMNPMINQGNSSQSPYICQNDIYSYNNNINANFPPQ
jgi:hypothetical protein